MDRSVKAARLADQLRDYLAQWTHESLPGYFFSITEVTLTPDLRQATVWVEIGQPEYRDKVLAALKQELPQYQHRLYRQLSKQTIPSLQFSLDIRQDLQSQFDQL